MEHEHVRLIVAGNVAEMTIARPPVNALTIPLLGELQAAAREVAANDTCRVLVIRTGVAGSFVCGADLKQRDLGNNPTAEFIDALHTTFRAIERLSVPTIAVIEGHALGGGCELALVCDFRLMAIGPARIGLPEVKLGLLAAGGGTQRLSRLIGRAAATDLIIRGRLLDATAAAAVGLVHRAIAPEHIEHETRSLTDELVALPPLAVAAAKRLIREGPELPLQEAIALEAHAMLELESSADAAEGVRAFVEKRAPRFSGR